MRDTSPPRSINGLPAIWVVYRWPRDFPGRWVVRVWYGMDLMSVACVCDSIGEARECVPWGAVRLAPTPGDDKAIFETWL